MTAWFGKKFNNASYNWPNNTIVYNDRRTDAPGTSQLYSCDFSRDKFYAVAGDDGKIHIYNDNGFR